MKHASDPRRKGIFSRRHSGLCIFATGLLMSVLAVFFLPGAVSTSFAFAAPHFFARAETYNSSPSQGPVGAVIAVTGSGVNFPDGTQINFGYMPTFPNCTGASDSQPGIVHGGAFSGWFRWPAGTGTGTFQLCAAANGSNQPFFLRTTYNVLSTSAPQVAVAPATLDAGKQATVSGTNFLPAGTSVNFIWRAASGGQSISLGAVSSDATGAFTQNFTVPSKSGTSSYTLTATAGSGQPPTLSASTTFPVNGITIVVVPTPTAHPSPTAVSTAPATATSTSNAVGTNRPADTTKNNPTTAGAGLLLLIALGGLLLIVAALVAGVFVVRRQRGLAVAAASGGSSWSATSGMLAGGATLPGTGYPRGASTAHPGLDHPTIPHGTSGGGAKREAIPFDPILAEAMREAQVSLFATPRPPVGEEVPS